MADRLVPDKLDSSEMIRQYQDRIYRYVLNLVHDPAEAEDLTQETFLRAYRNYASLQNTAALTSWLYRIATHVCFDRLRQRARRKPLESEVDLDDVEVVEPEMPSLLQLVEQHEMSACVQRYLDDLSDTYRAVILLHDLHGLSASEIAKTIGVSLPTVKIRLHRARLKLRAALEAGCEFSHDERGVLACESRS
jgi:RNA polymerase sigma-70 factor (ECF subfamily)